jgi:hypothetical protein
MVLVGIMAIIHMVAKVNFIFDSNSFLLVSYKNQNHLCSKNLLNLSKAHALLHQSMNLLFKLNNCKIFYQIHHFMGCDKITRRNGRGLNSYLNC